MPTLSALVDLLHGWYPPATAEQWDAVGLVAGDPGQPVRRVMFAIDPVEPVAREAAEWGADLLVVHHPLFLTGVHGVARTTPKGRTLGVLQDAGCALLTAHTNADQAVDGVSQALAEALGLTGLRPLTAAPGPALDKVTTYVPVADAETVRTALAGAGAGVIGDYDQASFSTPGQGRFRPLAGARPHIGTVGELEVVDEVRLECVLPRTARTRVVAALLAAHPYEEPAFDLLVQAPLPSRRGTGRVGTLAEPTTLQEFVRHAAAVLPATAWGVRAAGDPARAIRTVAVCGGSGGSLTETARRAGADVYLTADLRHHPTLEAVTERGGAGMALVDAAHWATEAPWLDAVAAALVHRFGTTVDVRVSRLVTDPWTLHSHATSSTTK